MGRPWGLQSNYCHPARPEGVAQACLGAAKKFLHNEPCALIFREQLFLRAISLSDLTGSARQVSEGCLCLRILRARNPSANGVWSSFDNRQKQILTPRRESEYQNPVCT